MLKVSSQCDEESISKIMSKTIFYEAAGTAFIKA
jgi:hypothetical protein